MDKQFILHKESGVYVARDGEVFVPKSGTNPAHYTYGCVNCDGYRQIKYRNKQYKVHRLIAEVFIPNPENKPKIDHINTNRSDNRVENLRWCTQGENNNNPLTRQHFSEAQNREEVKQKISASVKAYYNRCRSGLI